MKNRSTTVSKLMQECLYTDSELEGNNPKDGSVPVIAEGILLTVGFNPNKIQANKETIKELLTGLPNEFYKNGGGGWSFLNLCNDKDGVQWTSFHKVVDELCMLGIAAGYVKWCVPDKSFWRLFPGGMPYLIIDLEAQ